MWTDQSEYDTRPDVMRWGTVALISCMSSCVKKKGPTVVDQGEERTDEF